MIRRRSTSPGASSSASPNRWRGSRAAPTAAGDAALLRKAAGAAALVDAIRQYGHLAVQLDPLGTQPPGAAELKPEFHGITEQDWPTCRRARSAIDVGNGGRRRPARCATSTAATLGLEFEHLGEEDERDWFRARSRRASSRSR